MASLSSYPDDVDDVDDGDTEAAADGSRERHGRHDDQVVKNRGDFTQAGRGTTTERQYIDKYLIDNKTLCKLAR